MSDGRIIGRLVGFLHHSDADSALDAYRRAGAVVFDLHDSLEGARLEALVAHEDPWEYPGALQSALLCGWNALCLQICADIFSQPPLAGAGELEEQVAGQAMIFYGQVPRWVSRAQQALQNPSFRLDVAVPVSLPDWPARGASETYVRALLDCLGRVAAEVEPGMASQAALFRHVQGKRAAERMRQVAAEADAAATYARGLCEPAGAVVEEAVSQGRLSLERWYTLGQLVATPALALGALPPVKASARRPGMPPPLPAPGQEGFDAWCLTDHRALHHLRRSAKARRAIHLLWQHDPDPVRTLAIKRELDGALVRGDVALDAGHHAACPWPPVYLAKRPVKVAGRTIQPLQEFTLDIALVPGWRRPHFRRRVLIGPFLPD